MKANKFYDQNQRYQTIKNAARTTGLSQAFLRTGCKTGTVPHVKCGRVFKIDVPALYQQLEAEWAQKSAQ